MAAAATRVAIPGASFSLACSSKSPHPINKIISNEPLLRTGSKVSNRSASSSNRVTRSGRSNGEAERDQNAVLVSRRWAALLLPAAVTTLGGGLASFPSGEAMAEDVAIGDRVDVESGAGQRVELRTLNGCGLGVARYPDFVYNADGGGGSGRAHRLTDGRTHLLFDAERLFIPAVSFGTTTILGLPLPPGLKIEIVPKTLEGYLEQATGKVELNFLANFYFTAGSLYSAPPLVVDTKLTTESAQGVFREGRGQRLDSSGNVRLVGVARLATVNDLFLSTFLTLPTDCLAELSANLSFP